MWESQIFLRKNWGTRAAGAPAWMYQVRHSIRGEISVVGYFEIVKSLSSLSSLVTSLSSATISSRVCIIITVNMRCKTTKIATRMARIIPTYAALSAFRWQCPQRATTRKMSVRHSDFHRGKDRSLHSIDAVLPSSLTNPFDLPQLGHSRPLR